MGRAPLEQLMLQITGSKRLMQLLGKLLPKKQSSPTEAGQTD
jgi:hypothetical protein